MIFIVDFGSQTAHLIGRRVRELGSDVKIVHPEEIRQLADDKGVKGIILSGGPSSVYQKGAPTIDFQVFSLGIPILCICYGLQLMAKLLGGKVVSGRKEYGPATLKLRVESGELRIKEKKLSTFNFQLSTKLPQQFTVWMSHGDEVVELPKEFEIIGSTEHVKNAFVADEKRKIYGVQFHPEVEHTENGQQILKNFLEICSTCHPGVAATTTRLAGALAKRVGSQKKIDSIAFPQGDSLLRSGALQNDIMRIKDNIKKTTGEAYVIGAVSGGVDSTVAGTLAADAIGSRFIPIYVDNGLMRDGTCEHIRNIFKNHHVKPILINVKKEMLKRLKGIADPEKKRKIIGNFYIEIFENEMQKLIKSGKDVKFLLQGTIYSDVIESQGTKHASKIKSHHNVGGLPKKMKLKLLEPLKHLYKDEVREVGKLLDLPDEFVYKQPFPGPGYAIRIRGEVTRERLEKERKADNIVMEELRKAGLLRNIFISFPVMTDAFSTAVKGDGRFFGEVIALRVVESKDIMTSKWSHLPYDVLQKISSRIVNEVPGISRVVYDITTKPPATMEWE